MLALASGEAVGADPEPLLPAAAAVELVHSFSLVHDDLPALDNDTRAPRQADRLGRLRRGDRDPRGRRAVGEAFRLALTYPTPDVARELVGATLAMIGGQQLDLAGGYADLAELHRLKTGALFSASVMCGLWAAGLPEAEHPPWRASRPSSACCSRSWTTSSTATATCSRWGRASRALADAAAERAQARLAAIDADTAVLSEIVAGLAARTS